MKLSPSPTVTPLAWLLPSNRTRVPNWVLLAMRSMVPSRFSISFWSAWSIFRSFAPELAAWSANWRILTRMELTSFSAPSAVWTMEIEVSEFLTAWFKPATWARICSEIMRSAGPSAPELIFNPEDNRSRFLSVALEVFPKCLRAVIELILWLTRMVPSFD